MQFYWLVIGVLCVWRVTHLLSAEDGPANLFVALRRKAGNGFWGGLLDCFYCLSLWVAAPLAALIGEGVKGRILLWLALSAGAILLERVTADQPAPVAYFENGEHDNVMLREDKKPDSGHHLESKH